MAEQESVYLWSTTALTNASIDPAINWAEGQLPSTVNNSARELMTAIARFVKDIDGSLTTAGSANAYTLTINGRQTPLATGHRLSFKANFANTSAATLAVTNADAIALGTKAIRGPGDIALVANQITSGGVYDVRYDTAANSAAGAWILINPAGVAGVRSISAAGLATGGGDLSADRTITVTAATQANQETATSSTTVITPSVQQFHPGHPKAWVFFAVSGGVITILASYNVTSVTYSAAGQYKVNFTTPFSNVNLYGGICLTQNSAANPYAMEDTGRTASQFPIVVVARATGSTVDTGGVSAMFFGDQ